MSAPKAVTTYVFYRSPLRSALCGFCLFFSFFFYRRENDVIEDDWVHVFMVRIWTAGMNMNATQRGHAPLTLCLFDWKNCHRRMHTQVTIIKYWSIIILRGSTSVLQFKKKDRINNMIYCVWQVIRLCDAGREVWTICRWKKAARRTGWKLRHQADVGGKRTCTWIALNFLLISHMAFCVDISIYFW